MTCAAPPDFVIAGAMRCATTWLFGQLARTDGVAMAARKEPHAFAYEEMQQHARGPGDAWFAQQLTPRGRSYDELFTVDRTMRRGEASATYLYWPDVPARLRDHRADLRVVIVLRDPVDRTYSSFHYQRFRGYETCTGFESALAQEPHRRAAGWGPIWHYVEASRYLSQLRRFYDVFPREQVHVVLYEELMERPREELSRVTSFLGVGPPPAEVSGPTNRATEPWSPHLSRILGSASNGLRPLRNRLPAGLLAAGRRLRQIGTRERPPLDEAVRQELQAEFEPERAAIESLTGVDLTSWL